MTKRSEVREAIAAFQAMDAEDRRWVTAYVENSATVAGEPRNRHKWKPVLALLRAAEPCPTCKGVEVVKCTLRGPTCNGWQPCPECRR